MNPQIAAFETAAYAVLLHAHSYSSSSIMMCRLHILHHMAALPLPDIGSHSGCQQRGQRHIPSLLAAFGRDSIRFRSMRFIISPTPSHRRCITLAGIPNLSLYKPAVYAVPAGEGCGLPCYLRPLNTRIKLLLCGFSVSAPTLGSLRFPVLPLRLSVLFAGLRPHPSPSLNLHKSNAYRHAPLVAQLSFNLLSRSTSNRWPIIVRPLSWGSLWELFGGEHRTRTCTDVTPAA